MANTYVVEGAKLKCILGTSLSELKILPLRNVKIRGSAKGNIADSVPMVNIMPFGNCLKSVPPPPCTPSCGRWIGGKQNVLVQGQPALLSCSTLICMAGGGIISVVDDGQGKGESTNPDANPAIRYESWSEITEFMPENISPSDNAEPPEKPRLTDYQKSHLKKETGWPDIVLDSICSLEEAKIYQDAGLRCALVDGKIALIRSDIDFNSLENVERLSRKPPHSPINTSGEVVELHHIGQNPDSPLAELTFEEHQRGGNKVILHNTSSDYKTKIDTNKFAAEKRNHWQNRRNGA